jgi:hypothetical protein
LNKENINSLFERLKTREKPTEIAGKKIPDNLNLITWAQFADLQSSYNNFLRPFEIVLGLKQEKLLNCKLFEIIGFLLFVKNELERIVKLFESIKYNPEPEEVQAGINKLNFGLFGTLDWYARRMGYNDHAHAEQVPWIRIYKCLEIDHRTAKYEKQLRNIYTKKTQKK